MALLVIPARYASKRLPGKALLAETGKPLIVHVLEQARQAASVSRAVVATDDERIREAVAAAGGEAMLTAAEHRSGTDRVAEVARAFPEEELVVNLQGDEPEMDPAHVDVLVQTLEESGAPMATLAVPLASEEEFRDPAVVKVVTDQEGSALYFSRAPIPFPRDGASEARPLRHLGIYGFRREALFRFASLEPSALERTEKLEQLRALTHGMKIRVAVVNRVPPGVDTLDSYREFVRRWKARERMTEDQQ